MKVSNNLNTNTKNNTVIIDKNFSDIRTCFLTCSGENSCGQSFDYKGPFHESYCNHINNRTSNRTIENPHFVGAALIVPPNKPGWGSADITDIASKTSDEVANAIISDIAQEFPHVNPSDWENMMWSIQMQKFLKIS
jgi:hypothetical protein